MGKNLDQFALFVEKAANLISSFTQKAFLSWVLIALNLKPYNNVFEDLKSKLVVYKWWFDEYGNSLIIKNSKNIEIILCDLRIDRNKLMSTDLYEFLSLNQVLRISKLLYCFSGFDEDTEENFIIFSFFGIDNILRTYIYIDNFVQKYPSLYLGLNILQQMHENLNICGVKKINCDFAIYPCEQEFSIVCSLPVPDEFWEQTKENTFISKLLKGV